MLLTSFHIVSGTLGLISGGVAFYSQKGASVHRKSGIAFVISMLVMSATGAIIAAINSSQLSVIAGALTFYLVLTAYLTVQRPDQKKRILEIISLVIGSIVAASGLMLGVDAISSGDGQIDGKPAQVAVAFGGIAAIATLLDVKSLLWGSAVGKHRLLRHLWRMGVAREYSINLIFILFLQKGCINICIFEQLVGVHGVSSLV